MSDPRFARLKSDPRFRRPRRKESKLVVDDRFKGIFAEEGSKKKKSNTGLVDKYGRRLPDNHEGDYLKRFYRLEDEPKPPVDYARGEALLESSDEEGPSKDAAQSADDDSDDTEADHSRPVTIDPDAEIDLDETNFADLDMQAAAYANTHPEAEDAQDTQPTRRLAAVNLDWEHVRAVHLFKICSSLLSPTASLASGSSSSHLPSASKKSTGPVARGILESVRIYPSEFGKERMAREEVEGPPPEIFRKKTEDEEINAENIYDVGGEDDYDEDALRTYQLERLRYYYAIITCDTVEAATHIYTELDGTELERSANVFDLSYVPDAMTFDDQCRDEANHDPDPSFKGVDFVTDALRHSKVKLTWDEDDRERSQITRRALTRKEIENADFRAYLASSDSEGSDTEARSNEKSTKSKKASRDTLRALLLGGNTDELPEGWGRDDDDMGDVDMQITFTPGLSENKGEDETTLDTYQRKMKEKRKKRKEEKQKQSQEQTKSPEDNFFDVEEQPAARENKTSNKKRKPKDPASPVAIPRTETTTEELALLLASDNPEEEAQHFNLKSVLKAEKKSHRKSKRKTKTEEENDAQTDFAIDVADERFTALHENPQFAIDPSNPHFKKTKSMKALLEERSRRQKELQCDRSTSTPTAKHSTSREGNGLDNLVESVKRKSVTAALPGSGKRRRL